MNKSLKIKIILMMMAVIILPMAQAQQQVAVFKLSRTIPLVNVNGRVDRMDIDTKGNRLFVAAFENNTLEVVDLVSGKLIKSIHGLSKPQGVAFVFEFNKIYVTSQENGSCSIFRGDNFEPKGIIKLGFNADNMRYDAKNKLLYVGYDKHIGIIDVSSDELKQSVELSGHPESFQVEAAGRRIFVNVPTAKNITIINKENFKVIVKWPFTGGLGNYPMALDESQHRLLIGFWEPAALAVFDTETSKVITNIESCREPDDIFYDKAKRRIYMSCAAGFIEAFEQQGVDSYLGLGAVATKRGARTSLFDQENRLFYVAVPGDGQKNAEIMVYEVD